ncbi:MAG: rhomboid family intramembrane serine protease [Salinivirgaceae bacterium]|nr:rhomboid family intramembrane serine protease [Salinivirgaceae bacterium]MDD4747513.1 rhomboid family intramembrane serine protease [Salinivirgaceae bacterium]MDY0280964.1 rhomboid family intramembrane serine protease [Salinivirgaceae bacterium]
MQGYRPPMLGSIPPAVKNLLIINVLFFLGASIFDYAKTVELLGLFYPESQYFRPHQIITHMFMHGDLSHLFFNMFALFIFGKVLETVWGSKRFLIYYMVTGLGAVALHMLVTWLDVTSVKHAIVAFQNTPSPEVFNAIVRDNISNPSAALLDFISRFYEYPNNSYIIQEALQISQKIVEHRIDIPVIGASGAVFGVLLAFGMLFPNTEMFILFIPFPVKAKYLVIGYGILELFLGIANRGGDNVAHFAHLGGMIFGFFLIKYWNKKYNRFL